MSEESESQKLLSNLGITPEVARGLGPFVESGGAMQLFGSSLIAMAETMARAPKLEIPERTWLVEMPRRCCCCNHGRE